CPEPSAGCKFDKSITVPPSEIVTIQPLRSCRYHGYRQNTEPLNSYSLLLLNFFYFNQVGYLIYHTANCCVIRQFYCFVYFLQPQCLYSLFVFRNTSDRRFHQSYF